LSQENFVEIRVVKSKRRFAELIVVWGLLCSAASLNAATPWLHTDANLIKDPAGNVVVLRGVDTIDIGAVHSWYSGGMTALINRLTDKNDPCADYDNETDIDGEPRINNGRADIGADEIYVPKANFDGNEIVNFLDFALWAPYWLSGEPNEPNFSLDGDNDVDIDDLALFCDDWLWVAPWSELYGQDMEQAQSGSGDMVSGNFTETSIVFTEEPSADSVEEQPSESIDEPFSDEQIQSMIDWAEELWETNEDIRILISTDDYQRIIDSLKGQLED
jgi:hypothetical protein